MFCRHCGSKLEKHTAFCGDCGKPVSQSIQTAPAQPYLVPGQEANRTSQQAEESSAPLGKKKNPWLIAGVAIVFIAALVLLAIALLPGAEGARSAEQAATAYLDSYQQQDSQKLMQILHPDKREKIETEQAIGYRPVNYFENFPELKRYDIIETEKLEGEDLLDMAEFIVNLTHDNLSGGVSAVQAVAFVYAEVDWLVNDQVRISEVEITVAQIGRKWYYFHMN